MLGVGRRYLGAGMLAVGLFLGVPSVSSAYVPAPFFGVAAEVLVPANGVPGAVISSVNGLACVTVGNCVGVGTYAGPGPGYLTYPMVMSEINGTWRSATQLQDPASLTGGGLSGVACTSAGDCVATGEGAAVVTESNGSWGSPVVVQLPSDSSGPSGGTTDSIACPSGGECVAVGQYQDQSGDLQLMAVTESNGAWAQATKLQPPTDAGAQANPVLHSIACSTVGNCAAVGEYRDQNNFWRPMTVTESNGSWGQAAEVQLPSDADVNPDASATAVSCPSDGSCVAVGQYQSVHQISSGAVYGLPNWIATEVNGSWGQAAEQAFIVPPNGLDSGALDSLVCSDVQDCVAGGSYQSTQQRYQAMTVTETGDSWNDATEVTMPAGASATNQDATIAALACAAPGVCAGGGSYVDGSNDYQPMVVSSVPQLAFSTTGVTYGPPTGVVGSPYTLQLPAYGGTGNYIWSIVSGSLPPGLSLNDATGVVSGTPTAIGSWPFTVRIADPGPPGQAISVPWWIDINAAAPAPTTTTPNANGSKAGRPNTLITRVVISTSRRTATFRFKAHGVATSFRCALVKLPSDKHVRAPTPRYSACSSPKAYKHLKISRYLFYTAARGPDGNDPTPAYRKFAIG